MKTNDWNKISAAAKEDPHFASRLLDDPGAAVKEIGLQLTNDEAAIISAFCRELPNPEAIGDLAPNDVEILSMPNH